MGWDWHGWLAVGAKKERKRECSAVHEFRAFQREDERHEGEFHLRAIETRGLALHRIPLKVSTAAPSSCLFFC